MNNYLRLLKRVLTEGSERSDRTGVGTIGLFGTNLEFDLQKGFPAVTTKQLYFKSVAAELAGFLEGTQSAARMRELGTKIWDANANAKIWQDSPYCIGPDDMGRVYGALWRDFGGVNQLERLVNTLLFNPTDRRMVVTAWDPAEKHQCLPPCHIFWQVYVRDGEYLDLMFYMRSVDLFLGLPFDIASYGILMHLIAKEVGLKPGKMTVNMGDSHIYLNHIEQVKLQLKRVPKQLPTLYLDPAAHLTNFHPDHVMLQDYKYDVAISAPMAV